MKLTFRLLDQSQFSLEFNQSDTIKQVKEKIEKEKGSDFPVEFQKVIFAGKVFEDDKTLEECKIPDNASLVLFCKKPKTAPSSEKPAPQPTTSQPQPTTPKPSPQPTTQQPSTPISQPTTQPTVSSPGMVMGSEMNVAVENIVAMGFEKEQVLRAMRAAFNNPDRAVEYLMDGKIPDIDSVPSMPKAQPKVQPKPTPSSTTPTTNTSSNPTTTSSNTPINLFPGPGAFNNPSTPSSSNPQTQNIFDGLKQDPQFNMLRMMVQQNPQMLQPILQQLGQTNPQILQIISQHQEEFRELLNQPITQEEAQQIQQRQQQQQQGGTTGAPQGQQYVQVTPEEKEAIDRLEKLGFERSLVIEAFFACDKNENLAANYLFENGMDDDYMDDDIPPQ